MADRPWHRGTAILLAFVAAGSARATSTPAMVLDVQTHFEQGWPLDELAKVQAIGAKGIRDGYAWAGGEPTVGHYDFGSDRSRYIREACTKGITTNLVIEPRHPAYDGGFTVYSDRGRRAFAAYVGALLAAFHGCVTSVEIGNEINADGALRFPPGTAPAVAYAAILHSLYAQVHPRFPRVAIVMGSTNVIGTGFLESLFAAGALADVDAVAVHPYRSHPEGVDRELVRLKVAMRRHGGEKPIWATEFSNGFKRPADAAPHLLKMVALMSAAGVREACWYVLRDEPWFANMGLYAASGAPKPAADAFIRAVRLLSRANWIRVDTGDPRTFLFRTGDGEQILWGDPRPINVTGGSFTDPRGRATPAPAEVPNDPIVIGAGAHLSFGRSLIVGDSLVDFGGAPWTYFADRGGTVEPLAMTNWRWTSRYARADLAPLEINASTLAPADGADAVVRYTAPVAATIHVAACFHRDTAAKPMTLRVTRLGKLPAFDGSILTDVRIDDIAVPMRAGDTLDFAVGAGTNGAAPVTYRIWLFDRTAPLRPDCLA